MLFCNPPQATDKKKMVVLIAFASLLLIVVTIYLWSVLPQPILVFSIPIRLAAFIIAVTAFFCWKDWRTLPLALMFFLMSLRQTLTLHVRAGVLEKTPLTTTMSEVPGFIVTLLALISIIYIWNLFSFRKRMERAEGNLRDKVKELNETLTQIKTLKGIIPICMHCKGIRDDKGAWNQLEKYITENSDAQFSHGICDKCLNEHYPEYAE